MTQRLPLKVLILVLSFIVIATEGWASISIIPTVKVTILEHQYRCPCHRHASLYASSKNNANGSCSILIPNDVACDVRSIAEILWGGQESLDKVMMTTQDQHGSSTPCQQQQQGEIPLPASVPYSQRYSYFLQRANEGDPRAQHSVALLLWNGFAAATSNDEPNIDPEASARWHAAAAVQGNVDALAVLGGCLRTGSGVGACKNVAFGLRCIEYAASVGNPSGVNKKGAIMESNDDFLGAMRLYRECYEDDTKRINPLLLFNLGYCLVHGDGTDGDDMEVGERLWRDAVEMAPEEGSEEAAWFLYQQYSARDDEDTAGVFLNVAADLGHQDAVMERRNEKR
mmetsp:Transcript_21657/g.32907  ORF Transcript_21657/g.32907 Transcript_21657/m.32907 type:complete len:341 (-) Transcript_21657:473-1495(-)|eukprot:CAMPEP_0196153514 /NCGR_PEP_ID=MMETSP0910-20130528/37301_1 /TAXON_ID=49265 /ORGANISM="Thalassiosira rotula, Strain GSO102" /LENGTH=340 /DNA_ID=CAMNT_0041417339 /DNA_START=20 /DNA_END=1042 /DNA_ORIENTATION=-